MIKMGHLISMSLQNLSKVWTITFYLWLTQTQFSPSTWNLSNQSALILQIIKN